MKTTRLLLASLILFTLASFAVFHNNPAIRFVNSLDQDQKNKVLLPFDDPSKLNWHFLPGNMWPRWGLMLAELEEHQKDLFFSFLRSSLSESGYVKTRKIIDLENVLREISGDSVMRDPEKYFIAIYGNPEKDSLWAWSFEGHHLSLNFTILNHKTSFTPRFMGASPAVIKSGPRTGERTLDREDDLGLELVNSLNDEQRSVAIFQQKPFFDLATMNSSEVGPLHPVGIKYGELNEKQRNILQKLIFEYISIMPTEIAEKRLENLRQEEIDEVRFGWAGDTKADEGHYYRIQGTTFLIEFDNSLGGANHIHSVWRDFKGDFGRDLIREHYRNSNHH